MQLQRINENAKREGGEGGGELQRRTEKRSRRGGRGEEKRVREINGGEEGDTRKKTNYPRKYNLLEHSHSPFPLARLHSSHFPSQIVWECLHRTWC